MKRLLCTLSGIVLPTVIAATGLSAEIVAAGDWSGCHIGAGGSSMANETSTFAFNLYDGGSHTAEGPAFQLRAGCDTQAGQFVFGVLGTIDSGSLDGINAFYPVGPGFPEYLTTEVDWIGAVKARAGITVSDSLMLFGSAGMAWEHISYSDYDEVPVLSFEGIGDEVRQGYQLGLGAEIKVSDRGRLYMEYTYTDFGTADVVVTDTNPATVTEGSWSNAYTIVARSVSIGYSYRF